MTRIITGIPYMSNAFSQKTPLAAMVRRRTINRTYFETQMRACLMHRGVGDPNFTQQNEKYVDPTIQAAYERHLNGEKFWEF